ncbi:hypothetical protein [Prosthecobacter sp.]|uniref:hypothetical protein n=1 Tax=Prosthecobacter sp. TaxID=1965333 RepID=UPI00378328AF
MKTKLIAGVLAVFVACSAMAQQQEKVAGATATEPDAGIVAKLTEIVRIREAVVEIEQALYKSGRSAGEGGQVEMAEIELAEARVELAHEKGQKALVVTELQGLVAACERRVEWAKNMKKLARASEVEIQKAQVALLKAQVRLLREQK